MNPIVIDPFQPISSVINPFTIYQMVEIIREQTWDKQRFDVAEWALLDYLRLRPEFHFLLSDYNRNMRQLIEYHLIIINHHNKIQINF